jgi:hypothetical protein
MGGGQVEGEMDRLAGNRRAQCDDNQSANEPQRTTGSRGPVVDGGQNGDDGRHVDKTVVEVCPRASTGSFHA